MKANQTANVAGRQGSYTGKQVHNKPNVRGVMEKHHAKKPEC